MKKTVGFALSFIAGLVVGAWLGVKGFILFWNGIWFVLLAGGLGLLGWGGALWLRKRRRTGR